MLTLATTSHKIMEILKSQYGVENKPEGRRDGWKPGSSRLEFYAFPQKSSLPLVEHVCLRSGRR
ncbi:mCG146890 [Mus musculus]|nr:mCG146890 [Mus musculus]